MTELPDAARSILDAGSSAAASRYEVSEADSPPQLPQRSTIAFPSVTTPHSRSTEKITRAGGVHASGTRATSRA